MDKILYCIFHYLKPNWKLATNKKFAGCYHKSLESYVGIFKDLFELIQVKLKVKTVILLFTLPK